MIFIIMNFSGLLEFPVQPEVMLNNKITGLTLIVQHLIGEPFFGTKCSQQIFV